MGHLATVLLHDFEKERDITDLMPTETMPFECKILDSFPGDFKRKAYSAKGIENEETIYICVLLS
jgi:hypothetical protein